MSAIKVFQKLKDDYRHYAEKNLKIIDKQTGALVPFVFNEAQLYIHKMVEEQRKRTGKVRANILKARQQGASTYIQGRAYWQTTSNKGYSAFIMTHLSEATENLFGMTRRFHEHCAPPLKPATSGDSVKSLKFGKLDSQYRAGTAGSKNTGVSTTNRFIHGSEVALWENSGAIAVGLFQTVPNADNTEIFRESTARGMGNYFHTQWKKAEAGDSDYINIFVPWYWSSEYSTPAPDDFEITEQELEEVVAQFREFTDLQGVKHVSLTYDQLHWRRLKISELAVDSSTDAEAMFKQEYPMTAAEAFMATSVGGIIEPKWVIRARACNNKGVGNITMGVDPAWKGDRFSIAVRRGLEVLEIRSWSGKEIETIGQRKSHVTTMYKKYVPERINVDQGAGMDLVSLLHEEGYPAIAIPFGGSPDDADRYPNKRSEMWGRMAMWFKDESYVPNIPDSDALQADLCAGLYKPDTNNRMAMVKKDIIKKQLGFSPDEGDALALTFATLTLALHDNIIVESNL